MNLAEIQIDNEELDENTCKSMMEKLGRCIDRCSEGRFPDAEIRLCAAISNGLYLLMLTILEIKKSGAAAWESYAATAFRNCMVLLDQAMDAYMQEEHENMSDAIENGMRAIHSFYMAKKPLNQLLKNVQADNESSQSSEETSHS